MSGECQMRYLAIKFAILGITRTPASLNSTKIEMETSNEINFNKNRSRSSYSITGGNVQCANNYKSNGHHS